MKRENKYLIIKLKDINDYLSDEYKQQLSDICAEVVRCRYRDNRPDLKCVVVEEDWPEYESTWKAIEQRVDAETQEG